MFSYCFLLFSLFLSLFGFFLIPLWNLTVYLYSLESSNLLCANQPLRSPKINLKKWYQLNALLLFKSVSIRLDQLSDFCLTMITALLTQLNKTILKITILHTSQLLWVQVRSDSLARWYQCIVHYLSTNPSDTEYDLAWV